MCGLVSVRVAVLTPLVSRFEKFLLDVQAQVPLLSLPSSSGFGITWEEEEDSKGGGEGVYTLAAWRKKAGIKV